ncbi:hypothetical protein ACROYT_G026969 [Oculina patagonica]
MLLASSIALVSCEYCEPVTVRSCSNAGYRFTARFPDVDGTPYQDFHAASLNIYIPLLETCSPDWASTILCSLYLPKCEEGRSTAWSPCRKVCTQFVSECQSTLRAAGLAGMFTVLCDLLPDGDGQSKECFYPSNFKDTSSGGPVTNVCYDVVDQKCKNDLHYSKTLIPTNLQKAEDTIFKVVIDSNCSKELEKFICYTQFPPCYPNRPSVTYIPCKSLCDTINKKCWKQFIKSGLPLPHCDYIYPREDNATGLCEVKEWPAQWPKKFRPPPPPIGTCEELTVKSCRNAGYKYTAKYPKFGDKSFQEHKGDLLDILIPPLTCSPYSSLILCSLFLPKCVPGSGTPMLPCRQVCLDFTDKCKVELQLASTLGMTIALCDLLPVYDGTPNKCIMPKKFLISSTTQLISVRDVCYPVTSTKCSKDLHYDKTFLPTKDQKASELTLLQPIIDSGCSPDIEKYLCQTRMPPCTADISVVHMPCREFCKRITRDCGDVLKAHSIPALHCDYLFPPGDSSNGLCDLKRWPVPWPWKIPEPNPPVSDGPTNCVPLKAKACLGAGYDLTADFPPIDGKSYQQVKGKSLEFFLNFLNLCSPYGKTIMCSFYMPKCVAGVQKPVLPCRSVCLEFVSKCQGLLALASHAGMFRALCDLLPQQDYLPNTCFKPKGFKPSTASTVARRGGECSKVVEPKFCPKDLHYNQTFVLEKDQTSKTALQSILNSKCSPELEKYLCYTTVPPCKPNDLSVYMPCRSVCEQVRRDCGGEFKKNRIPLPDCSVIYPDDDDPKNKGLCHLTVFPVAWPAKRAKAVEERQKASNKGGLIAGIVILLGVLIAAVVIGVMYFRWRRGAKQFTSQRFENVEPHESNA